MASSINASTSGAGGVITTADSSGVLNIQTAGNTAVTIDTSQRAAFVAGTAALPAITTTGDTNTGMFFPAADTIAFAEGGTESMRIDSSGNVGIGTSSPVTKLDISSSENPQIRFEDIGDFEWRIGITGNSNFGFFYGGSATEAMRIAANGYVGIGTTNASNPLSVRNNTTSVELGLFENTASSGNPKGILSAIGNNGNNTSSFHFAGLTQGVGFWYLYGNGTSSWTSDERKKKNIETTRNGYIDDLCKLRVVKYNWKTDEDTKPKELGLIAQEVEQVFPGLIQDALHEDNDGVKYKTIKGSVLPYMLLKAIQEQQTIINDLKARITALEGAA
jgi:hypothetical protein